MPSALARHYGGGSANNPKSKSDVNWLRSRNYYIYQFTNPFRSFARNLVDAIHVFLVSIKAVLRNSPPSILFEICMFGRILLEMKIIHTKWRRDQSGIHPIITTKKYETIRPEVIRGTL